MPQEKKYPHFVIQKWKTKKTGEVKYAYYHRGPSPERKTTPLGTDYPKAFKKWAELEGVQLEPTINTIGYAWNQHYEMMQDPSRCKLGAREIKDRIEMWNDHLKDVVEHVPGDQLLAEDCLAYFELRSSKSRADKELRFLRTLINWANRRGHLRCVNPLNGGFMKELDTGPKRNIYVRDEWYTLTYKHGTQLVRDAMEYTYLCGNRPDETAQSKLTHIEGNELIIYLSKTEKSGIRIKRIPITGQLKDFIERRLKRKVHSPYIICDDKGNKLNIGGNFKRQFKKARDDAEKEAEENNLNYTRFQFRDLRPKAATDIERDFDIEAARKLLGHTTQKQTADYIRPYRGLAAKAVVINSELLEAQETSRKIHTPLATDKTKKLQAADVIEILKDIKNGESNTAIAKKYKVSDKTISNIRLNRSWKKIPRK